MIRDDRTDVMFENEEYKFNAIIEDIKDCVARNQPVLVGTVSVEKSEMLSQALDKVGIKHNVLNAKFHAQEAEIVAEAGAPGAVTIATNMAGRGTDHAVLITSCVVVQVVKVTLVLHVSTFLWKMA